jgi:hypothetical protein
MLINKFSFKLAGEGVNIEENFKRRVFPYEQLRYWLQVEQCGCARCTLIKAHSSGTIQTKESKGPPTQLEPGPFSGYCDALRW